MDRYLLFSGEAYYPGGGAEDFRGSYPTLVECMQADGVFDQWWNVLDTRTGRVYNYHEVEFGRRLEWAAGIDADEEL
jgi:hypothetical protein